MKTIFLIALTLIILSCNNNNTKQEAISDTETLGQIQMDSIDRLADMPKSFEEIGLEYAQTTQKLLGKNLMAAIQNKGIVNALEFCNIKAIPLTDSMANLHNAIIKRVSDQFRNPDNKPNDEELNYINTFKAQLIANQAVKPIIIEKENKVHFYYPIITNKMCLQCHGDSKSIDPNVKAKIIELYPNDLALGYDENQIRGIWSIQFDK